ncbi:hypothetical protein CHU98_g1135 [Xylaria longipes]|nr:hypothetical protein CHU98_g1135 [Xylaria longipes]
MEARQRSQKDNEPIPQPNTKPKRCLTLRINQVPLDLAHESFENDLKSIAIQDFVLHEAVNTLNHLTLVRMNKHSSCATATFHTSLSNDELVRRIQIASDSRPYKFDSDFYGITPIYDHENDTHADLVAVPGLGSHALGSCKSSISNEIWLRDYLPYDTPNQRVIIYGHNTRLQGAQSKQSIGDLGARFMETITRFRADTGALIRSLNTSRSNIHKACYGMLFFGVPNLGLRNDQLLTIAQGEPNQALIESLVVDRDSEPSEYLRRISGEFSKEFEGEYVIITFFERSYSSTVEVLADGTLSKTGKEVLLVTKESATKIGVVPAGKEDNIPFDADHSGLVKYDRGHEHYEIVRGRLEEVIADAKTKVAQRFAEQKGTCTWLHGHSPFKEWSSGRRILLWIKGKPGSGKSTLLKYALAFERNKLAAESKKLVISFFFHARGDKLQKTRLGFYRSLLYQLLQKFPGGLPGLVDKFVERHRTVGPLNRSWNWHVEELRAFLEASLPNILKAFSITLFVDALDEAGEDNAVKLVSDFKMLVQRLPQSSFHFRICFSCRHYPILETDYGFRDGLTILVEDMHTADIEKYVEENLQDLPSHQDYMSLITSRAAGIFLCARLVVQQVLAMERNGKRDQAIQREIEKIPQDLNNLYQRLIEMLEDRAATVRLTQWICFAERPLSARELQWAMIIDPDGRYKSLQECRDAVDHIEDNKINTRVNVLSCGLAEITQHGTGTVQFIHQSVKDFFTKDGLVILADNLSPAKAVSIEANYCLVRSCLRYIAMEEFARLEGDWHRALSPMSNYYWAADLSKYPESELHKSHSGAFHFLHYAVTSWVFHAKNAEGVTPADYLLRISDWPLTWLVSRWYNLGLSIGAPNHNESEICNFLHLASMYGLTNTVSSIITNPSLKRETLNLRNGLGQTPLFKAAMYGHEAIVQLFLNADGVDVDSKDNYGQTPLWVAARSGNECIVQLLLDMDGVDADSKHNNGTTPLWMAAESGHEAVVRLLLNTHRVDVDLKEYGRTPLLVAIKYGYEAIVRLLLEANAKVNSQNDFGGTPLLAATGHGHEAIVRLLLEANANVDSENIFSYTPLLIAAEHGYEAIARLLLGAGADVGLGGGGFCSPLSTAAGEGRRAVTQLLLDAKADPNFKYKCGRTPLWDAAANGNESSIRLLLKAGADVNSKDNGGQTPLWIAAWFPLEYDWEEFW